MVNVRIEQYASGFRHEGREVIDGGRSISASSGEAAKAAALSLFVASPATARINLACSLVK